MFKSHIVIGTQVSRPPPATSQEAGLEAEWHLSPGYSDVGRLHLKWRLNRCARRPPQLVLLFVTFFLLDIDINIYLFVRDSERE